MRRRHRPVHPLPPRLPTSVIPRAAAGPPAAGAEHHRRPLRVARLLTALLVVALSGGIAVLSGSDQIASADVCIDRPESNTWGPEPTQSGIDGMIAQAGPAGTFDESDKLPDNYPTVEDAINDTSHTDYEKLGTAGTLFSVDYGSQDSDQNPCFPITKVVGNFLANSIFNLGKVISRLSISTYQWATSPSVLAPLNDPLDEVTNSYWLGLIRPMLAAAILLGVATVLWLTLFRRRFAAGIGAIIWMIFATAILLLYVVKPSAVASTVDSVVAKATSLTQSANARSIETKDPHVSATYTQIRAENPDTAGSRIAADMMWRVMVFQPWLAGQWGRGDGAPIMMKTDPGTPPDTPEGWYDGSRDARYQQLYSQACVLDPAVAVCDSNNNEANAAKIDLSAGNQSANRYAQGWYMVQNWTCSSADWCIGPVGNPDGGDDDDDREVNASNGWDFRSTWSGDRTDQRFLGALTGGAVAASLGAMIFVLSAAVIVFDLIMYALLFFAGFFLLIGIQPTWGRRLVEGLGTTIAQNGLKRIMIGLALSVMITIFSVIQNTGFSWGMQIGLMLGTAVAIVMIRRPLMDSAGVVKVGANGAGTFDGLAEGASDKATAMAARTGRRGTAQAVTAGKTGAAAAAGAPGKARRGIAGGRVGAEVARDQARRMTEAGTPLTATQKRRLQLAAVRAGAAAGRGSDNRFEAEGAADLASNRATRLRTDSTTRAAARRFANTEQGRAAATAQAARTAERGDMVRAAKLAERDEDVRTAASVAPKRYANTAQNFDGYDEDGAPLYVDRNRRRPAGSTSGRHGAQSDEAVLRGGDALPSPTSRSPRRSPADRQQARASTLRAARPWQRSDSAHSRRLREMRETSAATGSVRGRSV